MFNVLITGGELNNKGAQAMTFVTVDQIKRRHPDSNIYLWSQQDYMRSEEEKSNYKFRIISDGDINAVTILHKAGGIFKLLKLTGRVTAKSQKAMDEIYGKMDCVVDISGYGYGSSWGILDSFRYILTRCVAAKAYGIGLYLMPQSFGPLDFKGIPGMCLKWFSKHYFPYAKKIYTREQYGYDLLTKEYHLKNVIRADDIVLANQEMHLPNVLYKAEASKFSEIPESSVAVIPNDKNNRHGNKEKNLQIYKKIIDYLLLQDRTVFLIYHAREDLKICIELKNVYKENRNVVLLQKEFSSYEFNSLMGKFDYVVASRFHAVVHAYKNTVPCLIMGWSVKYKELAEKFEQQDYVFDVTKEFSEDVLMSSLEKLEHNAEEESKKISQKLKMVQQIHLFDELFGKQVFHLGDSVRRLCTSCGICKAVCPQKCISYQYEKGRYVPVIEKEKCIECGICKDICSCWREIYSSYGERPQNIYMGNIKETYITCAKDKGIRKNGTSGGTITAMVKELLETGEYDCAFLIDEFHYEDSLKTRKYVKGSNFDKTAKSRYLPVLHTDAVEYMIHHKEKKIIIVAVPCAVHSIVLTIKKFHLERNNILILGLFCDKAENYEIFHYFQEDTGKDIKELYFREKDSLGWPGNMKIKFKDGSEMILPKEKRTEVKEFFQMERCLYCTDKLNNYCDIAIGDNYTKACLPEENEGANTLLVRTQCGKRALEKAEKQLDIRGITMEMVEQSQHLSLRENQRKNAEILKKEEGIDIYPQEDMQPPPGAKERRNYHKAMEAWKLGAEYEYTSIKKEISKKRLKKRLVGMKAIPVGIIRRIRKIRKAAR